MPYSEVKIEHSSSKNLLSSENILILFLDLSIKYDILLRLIEESIRFFTITFSSLQIFKSNLSVLFIGLNTSYCILFIVESFFLKSNLIIVNLISLGIL